MYRLLRAWPHQLRVFKALAIRELITRYGRENIGFLWMMAEPLLFASLVGALWRFERGPEDHGIGVVAFVTSGYLPMVLFRSCVSRAVGCLTANASLLYHRQVTIVDLVLVRYFVELIGHSMAFLFIATVLHAFGLFPTPANISIFLLGWAYYALFTLSVTLVVAPLSEKSEVLEKIMPVTTYMTIPFSGAFYQVSWLSPHVADAVLWSPPVHGMEMMRFGIFGNAVNPHYDLFYPLWFIVPVTALGLHLCRRARRTLVVG